MRVVDDAEPPGHQERWRIWVRKSVALGCIALFLLLLFSTFMSLSYLYADRHHSYGALPNSYGIAFEEVELEADDGVPLAAWWMPANRSLGNSTHHEVSVVLIHGHHGTMAGIVQAFGPDLYDQGFNLFSVDLRNHGESGDDPSGQVSFGINEVKDVAAAVKHLKANAETYNISADRIVLYGGSMGGTVALMAAAAADNETAVRGVISDSAYASFEQQLYITAKDQHIPRPVATMIKWMMSLFSRGFDPMDVRPVDHLDRISVPYLITHCDNDGLVGFENYESLTAAGDPNRMTARAFSCENSPSASNHLGARYEPGYEDLITTWLDNLAT